MNTLAKPYNTLFYIEPELKRKFKAEVAYYGKTMQQTLIELIEKWTNDQLNNKNK